VGADVEIRDFLDEENLVRDFVELPYRIYRDDARWMPPFRASEYATFAAEHPFLKRGKERRFIAYRGGRAVARCAGILNPKLQEGAPPIGLVGFFESENDQEAADAVLNAACAWLTKLECTVARGPINRDTWHRYRIMTKGHREQPIMLEPYNKDYYAHLFVKAGWVVACDYFSTINMNIKSVLDLHKKYLVFAKRKKCTFRKIDFNKFEQELEVIYKISLQAFEDNYCFAPISLDEFLEIYAPSKHFVDPELVHIGIAPSGNDAGFAFGYPEYSAALASMGGSTGWFSKLQFWINTRRKPTIFNYKTVCVTNEARRTGMASALSALLYESAMAQGYKISRHCLMKNDNVSRRFDEGSGVTYKEYALFERPLV